jgi:hypothetical protein
VTPFLEDHATSSLLAVRLSNLEERTSEWFTIGHPGPLKIRRCPIRLEQRALVPVVTNVDGTGRLQTVSRRTNPLYWRFIDESENLTSVPIVLNTSFNENEPIVNTPAESPRSFLRTRMGRIALRVCRLFSRLLAEPGSPGREAWEDVPAPTLWRPGRRSMNRRDTCWATKAIKEPGSPRRI